MSYDKFGVNYIMSPAMRNYVDNLDNPHYLRFGLAIFNSEFIFGENYQSIIDKFYQTSISKLDESQNSMHKYGSFDIIDSENLTILMNQLNPFITEYFGINPTKKLYLYSDFSVHYGRYLDTKLDEHVDDSDITINICLRNNLSSTGLNFTKIVDTLFSRSSHKSVEVDLKEGQILIHRGKQPHKVCELSSEDLSSQDSERVNLILWLKL